MVDSVLRKQEKNMTGKIVELDFEQELYKYFGQVKDFTLGMRIAQRFYKLGKESQGQGCDDLEKEIIRYVGYPQEIDEDVSTTMIRKAARYFASWQKGHFWKDANGDVLPEIDKDVIALEGLDEENNYRVVFAHRVDPDRVIRTTIDNKPLELHPSRYGEAGWNLPNIKYWLDLELPKKV